MGELDYSVSAADTSAVALLSTQLSKNTAPIVLLSFTHSGATLLPVPIDNVNAPALAGQTSSGLVHLSTSTSLGEAASSDDARLADARTPIAGSVVDASVRTPVTNGSTNTDGSPQYDLTADPGGIGADKIIVRSMKERVSDVIANMYAAVAAVVAALAGHIGIGLGSPATHPMPTYSQVGAAPLSHITLPLGVTGSHPPQVNADSGGFEVNQAAVSGTPNDPAYGVFEAGTLLAALTHQGDLYSTLLNALVASPGGSPLTFTGPLTGLESVAQILTDHVNQTSGTTNPHGVPIIPAISLVGPLTGTTVGSVNGIDSIMNWVIFRFGVTGSAVEIALGMGTTRHSLFVPLPSTSFSYSRFVGVANLGFTGQYGVGLSGSYTVNNFRAALNLAPDGNTVSPGQVYAQVWNNTGGSQGPVLANIAAVAWRVGA
jgi:hypothetical protein